MFVLSGFVCLCHVFLVFLSVIVYLTGLFSVCLNPQIDFQEQWITNNNGHIVADIWHTHGT